MRSLTIQRGDDESEKYAYRISICSRAFWQDSSQLYHYKQIADNLL